MHSEQQVIHESPDRPALSESNVIEGEKPDIPTVVRHLKERGFVVLRGVLPMASVDAVVGRSNDLLAQPSAGGVWGYFRADHQKKVLLPTLLGKPVYDLIANEHIVDIAETYLGVECILAETNLKADRGVNYMYFPLHSDFAAGWTKNAALPSPVTQETMRGPLAMGAAIYFHDTTEGAFAYCEGTHKLGAPHGQRLADYPKKMQAEIIAKKIRVEGRKGDIVIFDDNGFHGPDHPSRSDRTIILVDYYRTDVLGNEQVTPLPIWSCDIGGLSPKQLRILGANSTFRLPFDEYKWSKIRRKKVFPLITFLINNAFIGAHLRMKLKSILLSALRR